jgi:serine/threonine protein kinase
LYNGSTVSEAPPSSSAHSEEGWRPPVRQRPPGTRVDDYQLLDHLADGSQAEVHLARDIRTDRDVVIKFPHARVLDNPTLAGRWRREIHLTESLAHPNIQCRLDIGEHHTEPYFVLEYASGGSLDTWISEDHRLPVGQAVQWGHDLGLALAYLHHLGIIHRDVKPGNLLVTDEMALKLADFGAATMLSRQGRWWHLPAPPEGTAEYLSPEQITGRLGDARSDIYGWGVVMYELLTGQVPHTGPDPMAAMAAHLQQTPVPLRDLRPDVPPALEAVVMTALRRQPEHRYQTALDLLEDLDHLDTLDLAEFDHRPDPPMPGTVGGPEGLALARFAAVVAVSFVAIVAAILVATVAFR